MDYIPDTDQHDCVSCGYLCDCGADLDPVFDIAPERCLSCTRCADSLRAQLVEATATAHEQQLALGFAL